MNRQMYLLWLVDDLHKGLALFVYAAVQEAAPLDGERQSAADVGLERVGCMPVKGHRRAVRRLLPATAPRQVSVSQLNDTPAYISDPRLNWVPRLASREGTLNNVTASSSPFELTHTAA